MEGKRAEGMGKRFGNGPRAPRTLLTKEALDRVLQIVWNNWEDPLTQTVKQAQVSGNRRGRSVL